MPDERRSMLDGQPRLAAVLVEQAQFHRARVG